jgi:hypothetical protein
MPIFGQVWLWSSLAFLLGALLCWALVALPARRRVGELESELSRSRREPSELADEREYQAFDEHEYDDRPAVSAHDEPEDSTGETLTRAYALVATRDATALPERGRRWPRSDAGPVAPPETDTTDTELADGPRTAATRYLDVSAGNLGGSAGGGSTLEAPPEVPAQQGNLGWFGDDENAEKDDPAAGRRDVRLVDDEGDAPEDGGTVFTQRTQPIPGEVIRRLDDSDTDEPADALVDDLAEQSTELEPTGASHPGDGEGTQVISRVTPDTEPSGTAPAPSTQGQTEVMPAQPAPPAEVVSTRDDSRRGAEQNIMPGVSMQAEPAKNPLPKRVPSKPPSRTPFGVKTAPAPDPAAKTEGEESGRALFEPIVPADEAPQVPPPHRIREGNGHGPFGPGSAMPMPDGTSPSPEFTIKASVSALRYCTPESPQFGRTVAEVWFKSPADAERVGFRPVG